MEAWLESLVPWGTEVIVWAQSLSNDWLDALFSFFTSLGYEEVYLVVLPLVYWCVDKQLGAALGFVSLLTAWANSLLKHIFLIPRPSDPRIQMRAPRPETSPSFPSGHAQNAVGNWGYLAYRLKKAAYWVVAALLIAGIGVSRVVLGVHFPQDVMAGWLIGAVILIAYAWLEPKAARWLKRQAMPAKLTLAILIPLLLAFAHPAAAEDLYPAEGSLTPMSAVLGFGVGLVLEDAWIRFSVGGEWWRRFVRLLVGLIVVGILYVGPKLVLPEGLPHSVDAAIRFVRYGLLGWAVAFFCPWLFVRLSLAKRETKPIEPGQGVSTATRAGRRW